MRSWIPNATVSRILSIAVISLLLPGCGKDNDNGTDPTDVDESPPARVVDLTANDVTETSATLTWTAPGDDGSVGTAKEYDIRYALAAISDSTWDDAIQARGEPSPRTAGTQESYVATGLLPDTTYFIALKSADEVPNWSAVSNNATATTLSIVDLDVHWWDGFAPPPDGMGMNEDVNALTVYQGDLIAGGRFTEAGGVPARLVARWDGDGWHTLGSGIEDHPINQVETLFEYNGDLIVGGYFGTAGGTPARNIARWDGSSWHPLGAGVDGGVLALAVYDGDLIAGGWFSTAGDAPANNIARWDGSDWRPLGPGLWAPPTAPPVSSLISEGYDLYAGGTFTQADSIPMDRIARWDGSSWHEVGGGIGGGEYATVYGLAFLDGDLIAAGPFSRAGRAYVRCVARWDGSSWSAVGDGIGGDPQPFVNAIATYGGNLIAAGYFQDAGTSTVQNIASWDGDSWRPLGSGLAGSGRTMTVLEECLFVGGRFTEAGGKPAAYIARWDE